MGGIKNRNSRDGRAINHLPIRGPILIDPSLSSLLLALPLNSKTLKKSQAGVNHLSFRRLSSNDKIKLGSSLSLGMIRPLRLLSYPSPCFPSKRVTNSIACSIPEEANSNLCGRRLSSFSFPSLVAGHELKATNRNDVYDLLRRRVKFGYEYSFFTSPREFFKKVNL